MYGKAWRLVVIVAAVVVSHGQAHAQNCASSLTKDSSVSRIINCIKDQESAVKTAQRHANDAVAEAKALRAELAKQIDIKQPVPVAIPAGSVVAFDLPNRCPKG